ncbi:molybdopterin binding domain containing protein [Akanthomyces lecanii RCEF 1005]|uniref:Molybdopterin binding domain containing protein n=1 Tax=Akanthomyces lecanii RCEF 1005 TaxID=1081108 RepID=A0A168IXT2_CORDF|nr:molybdopterin binding domain containing protein [Akanthomyces lecanii RCEF 1005]
MASAAERQRRTIQTAACLIIGDEVLGGKTVDTNSAYLAKWCFQLGLRLKKIEVVEDDEADIIDAVRRLSTNYDFVENSGGIGPTHDDITYQSIAKAFDLPLKLHDEAFDKMKRLSKPHPSQPNFNWEQDSPDLRAKLRMVYLPTDESRPLKEQFLFTSEELWVPVSVVNGNVHILPGIPRLFTALLDGIKPHIISRLVDPSGKGSYRVIIQTPYAESKVAGYLTDLAARVEPKGIKVGSYPHWDRKYNTVTLVGKDEAFLESLVDEVVRNVEGKRVFKPEDIEGGPLRESKA